MLNNIIVAGPCVGMDCMHGVLMHGDNELGDDHKHQDTFERLEKQDENKGKVPGPCQGMDCLHGVMMHGDKDQGVEHMHQDKDKIGPDEKKKAGPCEGMDCLHGVMMHGDAEQGHVHKGEDEKEQKPEENKEQEGPCVGMGCLHGVMMHGDSETGKEHTKEHADLMKNKHEGKKSGTLDLEVLMHGGKGNGIHSHEVELSAKEKERNKGVASVESPDGMLHGNMNEMITIGEAPHHEKEEYSEWKKKRSAEEKEDGGLFSGFSFPFITDTLINELDLMKRRYLSRFWGNEEDEIAYADRDNSARKANVADTVDDNSRMVEDMRNDMDVVGNTEALSKSANHHHEKHTRDRKTGNSHDEGL